MLFRWNFSSVVLLIVEGHKEAVKQVQYPALLVGGDTGPEKSVHEKQEYLCDRSPLERSCAPAHSLAHYFPSSFPLSLILTHPSTLLLFFSFFHLFLPQSFLPLSTASSIPPWRAGSWFSLTVAWLDKTGWSWGPEGREGVFLRGSVCVCVCAPKDPAEDFIQWKLFASQNQWKEGPSVCCWLCKRCCPLYLICDCYVFPFFWECSPFQHADSMASFLMQMLKKRHCSGLL